MSRMFKNISIIIQLFIYKNEFISFGKILNLKWFLIYRNHLNQIPINGKVLFSL
jgi:hypothetical protein